MRKALCLLCLTGCLIEGSNDLPVLKGDGAVKVDPATGKVTLDTTQVPILPACAAGQLVRRTAEGWGCADPAQAIATATPTWATLEGKPATFPPGTHTHPVAELDDLHWDTLPGKPIEFTPAQHSHVMAEIDDLSFREDMQWTDAGSAIYAPNVLGVTSLLLDQSYTRGTTSFSISPNQSVWQSFTAGMTGPLGEVRIFSSSNTGLHVFTLTLRAGEGTNGAQLYTDGETVTLTGVQGEPISIPIPTGAASVADGSTYTIVITAINTSLALRYDTGGLYPRGRFSSSPSVDMVFETYVRQPNAVAITTEGRLGLGTLRPTAMLDVVGDTIRLRTPRTIPTSSTPCQQGEIAWDRDYLYICVDPLGVIGGRRWARTNLNDCCW